MSVVAVDQVPCLRGSEFCWLKATSAIPVIRIAEHMDRSFISFWGGPLSLCIDGVYLVPVSGNRNQSCYWEHVTEDYYSWVSRNFCQPPAKKRRIPAMPAAPACAAGRTRCRVLRNE